VAELSAPQGSGEGPFGAAWREHRGYLLGVAYRLVGSVTEAEDMVQEAYARLLRADIDAIDEVRGWLVVVVTRLCLDHLRSARVKRESQPGQWLPEPLAVSDVDPADVVAMDESVRMALLIVLERLTPAERVVFVLHDVFDYSFEEIAPMVDRTAAACRQLGSRARRRIQAEEGPPRLTVDADEMRRTAERFIAACEGGELQPLLEVLDPAVVGWADIGDMPPTFLQPNVGRDEVAPRVFRFFGPATNTHLTLAVVNGEPGIIARRGGKPFAVIVLSVRDGLVNAIYSIVDPQKLTRIR